MNLNLFFPFSKLTAGDTWKWTVKLPNYPASNGWYLIYTAKKEGVLPQTFSSVASGYDHQITVPIDTTKLFASGSWVISVAIMSTDGEKNTVGSRIIDIDPDLSTSLDSYDPRSHAKKCFDVLEDVIFRNADRDLLEEIFMDHTMKYRSMSELLKLYNYFKLVVDAENGLKTGRIVYNRV